MFLRMDHGDPTDQPENPSPGAPSDRLSLFSRWPSCRGCERRMLLVSEDDQHYAFICAFCVYRASIPKT
jgi:hypothetical protein